MPPEDLLTKLPAIVASGFVLIYIADLIGNHIHFKSKVFNALVTAIVWGVLFVALDLFYGRNFDPPIVPDKLLWQLTGAGIVLAFISDLISNTFLFDRRFANAFLTSVIWAVLFAIVYWSVLYFEMY